MRTKALYNNLVINDVVNIGGEKEISMLALAGLIVKLTGSKSKIVNMPLPQDDPVQRKPDISLAKDILSSWTPSISPSSCGASGRAKRGSRRSPTAQRSKLR